MSTLLIVPLVAICGLPAAFLALPLIVAVTIALLWNSQWGLCFAAFAITTLGSVRYEIFDVTVYLPEAIILALVAKEAILFIFRRERFVQSMPVRALALYVCAALAAIGTSFVYRNGFVKALQDFRQFTEFVLLFWLVLQRVTTRQQAIQIALCYVFGSTLIALHAIVQHYTAIGILGSKIADDLASYRLLRSGSFYHVNSLGALMVLAVGPAAGLALASNRRSMKVIMVACIGLCLVAEVCTKSRGAWLSMMVSFAFIAVSIRPSAKTIALAAACAVVIAPALGPSIIQRISTLSDPENDISLMGRARFYTAATHIVRARPLFGLGWGCYYDIDKIVGDKRYVKTPRPPGAPDVTVHSLYLQLLVKTGSVGLLAFLVILVAWTERIWRVRKTKPRDNQGYALFVGITAGVAGCLFQNVWENFFHQPVIAQSFWLLLGMSFLTAHWLGTGKPSYGVPAVLVGVATALFLLFMYACLRLEKLDPAPCCFENNVADAMADGKVRKALRIARNAAQMNRYNPMAYTVYGRVLLECGEADEALPQLAKAVAVQKELIGNAYRETRRPYYFAPARLTLGKYCIEQDQSIDAVVHFELARAYAMPAAIEYSDFHAALYQAYAQHGLWARALEFGEPSDQELGDLASQDIVSLARVCEGKQNWRLVGRLAERLLTREGLAVEAHYLLGRVELAQERYEASLSHLERAVSGGHPHATFYLGTALEKSQPVRAIQAFLRAPSGDLYRPFALAKAFELLAGLPENEQASATVTSQELLDQLDQEIARMRLLQRPVLYDEDRRFTPLAVIASEAHFASGGNFPVITLWEDRQEPAVGSAPISLLGSGMKDSLLVLKRANSVLQIQWVENLVNWQGVERLQAAAGEVPGWVDTAREWFSLRPDHAAQIQKDGTGNSFLSITKLTWFYSVPIRVRDGAAYLLGGRLKGLSGKGSLGWQFLNEEEYVLFEDDRLNLERSDAWTWQVGYMRPQSQWKTMRVQLNVMPHAGTVAFDDVMLVEINEPSPTWWD
jgi:O-antigen ligase/tetratricopeptide (TPR) repeat protein